MTLLVKFLDSGREPQCPPDPAYPKGIDIDMSQGKTPRCTTALPYPAPRCGTWLVTCDTCSARDAITTAGRIDDPRSVKMACRRH